MKYTHLENKHNLLAPSIIAPVALELTQPQSVIDVGCGLGTFVRAFKDLGVPDVLGVDGSWVDKGLLYKYIEEAEFLEQDLEQPIKIERKYDLAISLEVAEHLSEDRAEGFVSDLTSLSDQVLFSAAIPGQGGDHHINEQWVSYWQEKFEARGYVMLDVIRDKIWDNEDVFWWYKQNTFLFVIKDSELHKKHIEKAGKVLNVIHPELLYTWINYKDRNALKRYSRKLFQTILFKLGLKK